MGDEKFVGSLYFRNGAQLPVILDSVGMNSVLAAYEKREVVRIISRGFLHNDTSQFIAKDQTVMLDTADITFLALEPLRNIEQKRVIVAPAGAVPKRAN
jgi:hypothetical protein